MKIIQDLFQTRQSDGTYKWDATNPAWSVAPWLLSALSYTAVGLYGAAAHWSHFSLMDFATGIGAVFAGGGIGVMFHSRSDT